jgi:hypothetical protein
LQCGHAPQGIPAIRLCGSAAPIPLTATCPAVAKRDPDGACRRHLVSGETELVDQHRLIDSIGGGCDLLGPNKLVNRRDQMVRDK